MKKRYERPSAYIEEFTPNEYVAACGDRGKVYKFTCDAGGGSHGDVWLETNGKPGLQILSDEFLGGYHACGTTHEAKSTDEFLDGYYKKDGIFNKAQKVIVWRGTEGNNTHCTTNLNMGIWETAKS